MPYFVWDRVDVLGLFKFFANKLVDSTLATVVALFRWLLVDGLLPMAGEEAKLVWRGSLGEGDAPLWPSLPIPNIIIEAKKGD
jgi:hypothetical protein